MSLRRGKRGCRALARRGTLTPQTSGEACPCPALLWDRGDKVRRPPPWQCADLWGPSLAGSQLKISSVCPLVLIHRVGAGWEQQEEDTAVLLVRGHAVICQCHPGRSWPGSHPAVNSSLPRATHRARMYLSPAAVCPRFSHFSLAWVTPTSLVFPKHPRHFSVPSLTGILIQLWSPSPLPSVCAIIQHPFICPFI